MKASVKQSPKTLSLTQPAGSLFSLQGSPFVKPLTSVITVKEVKSMIFVMGKYMAKLWRHDLEAGMSCTAHTWQTWLFFIRFAILHKAIFILTYPISASLYPCSETCLDSALSAKTFLPRLSNLVEDISEPHPREMYSQYGMSWFCVPPMFVPRQGICRHLAYCETISEIFHQLSTETTVVPRTVIESCWICLLLPDIYNFKI